LILFTECFETLPARVVALGNHSYTSAGVFHAVTYADLTKEISRRTWLWNCI
jgi:hypothetical protein